MKKLLIPAIALVAMSLASCDSKVCYCYNYLSNGTVTEEAIYTSYDHSCYALSQGVEGSVGSRVCLESNERMDPNSLASK